MKSIELVIAIGLLTALHSAAQPDPYKILERMDDNMTASSRIMEASMTIHGKRNSRTLRFRSYSIGTSKAFSEYISPPSEAGTKMLKLDNQLWIYSPATDRIIQISGHMLRQPVMGSDMSYEEMLEDRKMLDIYTVTGFSDGELNGLRVWVLDLTARVKDAAYQSQKLWVDKQRYIPVLQEMYARSGQLLKKAEYDNFIQVQGRWFPARIQYRDMLRQGGGTTFEIHQIQFDQPIPDHIFSKASLKQ